MNTCALCSTELKLTNTPTFVSGKLSDGGEICIDCLKKVNSVNPNVALKIEKYPLVEIQKLFSEIE